MSVDQEAIRGVVVSKVSEQYGPDMADYVDASMRTDPSSPFARMISDAITARTAIDEGRVDDAVLIVKQYRTLAASIGAEPLFDALMESLGIPTVIES